MKNPTIRKPTFPAALPIALPIGLLALALVSCSDDEVDRPSATPPALAGTPETVDAPASGFLLPGQSLSFTLRAAEATLAPSVVGRLSTQAVGEGMPATSVTGSGNRWVVTYTAPVGGPFGAALSFDITLKNLRGEAVVVAAFTPNPAIGTDDGWGEPVWSDEFDGSALNADNWEAQTGVGDGAGEPGAGWGNNELQTYAAEAASVADGFLTITASALTGGASAARGAYQSARLRSKGLRDFTYGRIEVRAQLPGGQGTWPAIWMLPTEERYGTWPLSGEIDIVEAVNLGVNGNTAVTSALHFGLPIHGEGPNHDYRSVSHDPADAPQNDFHLYAAEWEAGEIRFYFDETHYATMTAADSWYGAEDRSASTLTSDQNRYALVGGDAPFDQEFHILLNLAIGGNPVRSTPAPMDFPNTEFVIDYVRVYACASGVSSCGSRDADVEPVPGPPDPTFKTLKVYDGEFTVSVDVDGTTHTNTLAAGQFNMQATVTNMLDATAPSDAGAEAGNVFWRAGFMGASGNVGNVFLGSGARSDAAVLDEGFDLSGDNGVLGRLAFRMRVNALDQMTSLTVKMDSEYPDLGFVELTGAHALDAEGIEADGEWRQYAVSLSELIANPGTADDGMGLNLADVRNLFVLEATAPNAAGLSAMLDIDDIYVHVACREGCNAGPRIATPALPDELVVFGDALDARWDNGIGAFSALGNIDCVGGGVSSCGNVSWAVVPAADTGRGDVLQVSYGADTELALVYLQSEDGQDLSQYANGEVRFDIMVSNQGSAGTNPTFLMKVDCVHPCGSGDYALGVVGAGAWQTVAVNMQGLLATTNSEGNMLDLREVNTGLVIWPTPGMQAGVVFQIDNVVWDVDDAMTAQPAPVSPSAGVSLPVRSLAGGEASAVFNDDGLASGYSLGSSAGSGAGPMTVANHMDAERGAVIRIENTDSQSMAWVGRATAVDLSAYGSGVLSFDLLVEAAPSDPAAEWRVKIETGPCPGSECVSSDDLVIGNTVALGGINVWNTVLVEVTAFIGTGLDLSMVRNIVIFTQSGQGAGVAYQLDNIAWRSSATVSVTLFGDSDALLDGYSLDHVVGAAGIEPGGSPATLTTATATVGSAERGAVIRVQANGATQFVSWVGNAVAEDFSDYDDGTLSFDILVNTEPSSDAASWRVKVETATCGGACGGGAEYMFGVKSGATPTPTAVALTTNAWHSITVSVADLLDDDVVSLHDFRRVVFFNDWDHAADADFEIDNVVFSPASAD